MNGASVLTFLILASVMIWFIISGHGRWFFKFVAIIGVFGFAAIIWMSALSFTGWPTKAGLPEKALFLSGYAVEPTNDSEGAIYIWLISPPSDGNLYEYEGKDGEPRAYVLPYDRLIHEQVQAASDAIKAGKRVVFSKEQPEGSQPVHVDGQRSENRGGGSYGTHGGKAGFYILPPGSGAPKGG